MSAPIKTLTGLQNLPNLRELRADWNALESIDLSGCTNLEYADVSDCDNIDTQDPSLTQIDVTGCTSLIELRADDSDFSQNGIASIIGLAGLPALGSIDLDDCNLSGTVDLSGIPNLADIDLSYNAGLTGLNIISSQPITGLGIQGCGLTQNAVDGILVVLNANGLSNGGANFGDGTNASPSVNSNPLFIQFNIKNWSLNFNYPPSSQWDVAANADPSVACGDPNRFTNLFTASGSLTAGNTVYENLLLTAYPPDNTWYSDGSIRFQTVSGVIQTPVACV